MIAPDQSPDQKATVDRLLLEFETAAAAIWGSPARLRRAGISDQVISHLSAVRCTITHVLSEPLREGTVLSDWRALIDYLTAEMSFHSVERARALYLNTRNILLRNELLSEGTIDEATIHVREVIRRALELGAAAIILVHNHPSGCPKPSKADIRVSKAIQFAGNPLSIVLHDHVIIAGTRYISLRSEGLLA